MGLNIFYSGAGESASGLRKTQDYLDIAKLTVGMSIVNGAQRILNRPLALEMAGLLKNKGAASLDDYKKALNARFAKVGVKPLVQSCMGRRSYWRHRNRWPPLSWKWPGRAPQRP